MAKKSRRTVMLLLKSLAICGQMNREGNYVPPWDLLEAYHCGTRARNVLKSVARHILDSHEAEDVMATNAARELADLEDRIVDLPTRTQYSVHPA